MNMEIIKMENKDNTVLLNIEILDETIIVKNDNFEKINKTKIKLLDLDYKNQTYIGVDPGTKNLGIATIYPNTSEEIMEANLYKVVLDRDDDAIKRMLNVRTVLSNLSLWYRWSCPAVVEGASFGNHYRQVELAEQRASIALWCNTRGMRVKIVPPKTIRKHAFGDGNLKNPWDILDNNISAALGCALYGYNLM